MKEACDEPIESLPSRNGTPPDLVYRLDFAPWDSALHGDTFVVGGRETVEVWTSLPVDGAPADLTFYRGIGSVDFQEITGVALDDRYLYLGDAGAGKLHVWETLPNSASEPVFSLDVAGITRLASDGDYLASVSYSNSRVLLYRVAELSGSASPVAELPTTAASYGINLPQGVLVAGGHLFIADTNHSRVLGWESIEAAIAGTDPDVVLGQKNLRNTKPAIGKKSLFWPAGLAFHKNRLWVSEFKFSKRIVGFRFKREGGLDP